MFHLGEIRECLHDKTLFDDCYIITQSNITIQDEMMKPKCYENDVINIFQSDDLLCCTGH